MESTLRSTAYFLLLLVVVAFFTSLGETLPSPLASEQQRNEASLSSSPDSVSGPNGLVCAFCEMIIKEVLAYTELDSTEAKIMAHLKGVCGKLFNGTLLSECDQFFVEYGPTALKLVLQEVDPAKGCDALIGKNVTCVDGPGVL
eukprot:scpid90124/ scgid9884/ 